MSALPTIVSETAAMSETLAITEARMRVCLAQAYAIGGLKLIDSIIASARAPYVSASAGQLPTAHGWGQG